MSTLNAKFSDLVNLYRASRREVLTAFVQSNADAGSPVPYLTPLLRPRGAVAVPGMSRAPRQASTLKDLVAAINPSWASSPSEIPSHLIDAARVPRSVDVVRSDYTANLAQLAEAICYISRTETPTDLLGQTALMAERNIFAACRAVEPTGGEPDVAPSSTSTVQL